MYCTFSLFFLLISFFFFCLLLLYMALAEQNKHTANAAQMYRRRAHCRIAPRTFFLFFFLHTHTHFVFFVHKYFIYKFCSCHSALLSGDDCFLLLLCDDHFIKNKKVPNRYNMFDLLLFFFFSFFTPLSEQWQNVTFLCKRLLRKISLENMVCRIHP